MISVIGAGPAGLAAALTLQKAGLECCIYESKSHYRPKVCGGFLNPNAFKILDDLGVTHVLDLLPKALMRHFLLSVGQRSQQCLLHKRVYALSRKDFDAQLWQIAQDRGISLYQNSPVRNMISQDDQVTFLNGDSVVHSEGVILADGMNSMVNLASPSEKNLPNRIGIQFLVRNVDLPQATLGLHFSHFGYIGSCAYGDNSHDLSAIVDLEKIQGGKHDPLGILKAFMEQDQLLGTSLRRMELIQEPKVIARAIPRIRSDPDQRILLAGDAREFLEPFTGLGITHALTTGVIAACQMIVRKGGHPQSGEYSLRGEYFERKLKTLLRVNHILGPLLRYSRFSCQFARILNLSHFPLNILTRPVLRTIF